MDVGVGFPEEDKFVPKSTFPSAEFAKQVAGRPLRNDQEEIPILYTNHVNEQVGYVVAAQVVDA